MYCPPNISCLMLAESRLTNNSAPAARHAAVYGWVHIAFRAGDLMASLHGDTPPGIALRLYDGPKVSSDELIYDSDPGDDAPPRFSAVEHIQFPQHQWTLQVRSTPAFGQSYSKNPARIIAAAGVSMSLLLALFTWQLVTGRARAFARAHSMTRELREREERLRAIVETAAEGIVTCDEAGRIVEFNAAAERIFGYDSDEVIGVLEAADLLDIVQRDELVGAFQAYVAGRGEGLAALAPAEINGRRRDGEIVPLELALAQVDTSDGRLFTAVIRDISERKAFEQ